MEMIMEIDLFYADYNEMIKCGFQLLNQSEDMPSDPIVEQIQEIDIIREEEIPTGKKAICMPNQHKWHYGRTHKTCKKCGLVKAHFRFVNRHVPSYEVDKRKYESGRGIKF
jgi:hypothetical protein